MKASPRPQEDPGGPTLTAEQRRILEDDGYVVLPDVLTPEECDLLSEKTDEMWEAEKQRPRRYTVEAGVRFTDNLLRYSTIFERCLLDPLVLDGVRAVLGDDIHYYLINGRRADPGYGKQPLHDLKRERGRPFRTCNTIWCLDEFTEANGTRVVPGSHLTAEPYVSRCVDPLRPHPDETRVLAPRGAVVVFNSHLIHGGSENRGDTPRRCIHSAYAVRSVRPNYDWRLLPDEIKAGLKPESLALLGLDRPGEGGAR
ncbi:phytanoyl-CoA dioxygenase family protein [Streptomyces hoynatensis]|uniref:Phytanoyl-CoA dioxygenase n=1 Tax=Streptomyces hoynatensis TaxID=1141874 RepID=A0A3A9Z9H6_9ACTN|nr:phytanoyl-CoA dioxygenase family protein [Streptomyces hoynatensis]RKN44913.1 hypothetical protein D7294_07340 [Streptomyces hoynatensis]